MQIKDQISYKTKPKPITFQSQNLVSQAIEVMCEKNIGSIIVVNPDQTVAGIVTERDMMIRVLGAKIDPASTKLSEIMTNEVKVARETDDLLDWMKTMSSERFRHLPIVDEAGKLVNMMSQGDFLIYTWPDLYEKVKQDIKGRLGKTFQILLIIFAIITLILIGFNV